MTLPYRSNIRKNPMGCCYTCATKYEKYNTDFSILHSKLLDLIHFTRCLLLSSWWTFTNLPYCLILQVYINYWKNRISQSIYQSSRECNVCNRWYLQLELVDLELLFSCQWQNLATRILWSFGKGFERI